MQFLKTLLIVFTVAIAVAFAFNNWDVISVRLWGDLLLDINLPLLLLAVFLAGMIPTWLWQRAVRWRLRGRLNAAERTIADLRQVAAAPVTLPAVVDPGDALMPADGEPVPPEPRLEPRV